MSIPSSPRVVYRHNPLVEVICQLRFPSILRIASADVADFQDKIRREYPLYGRQEPPIGFEQMPAEVAAIMERLNVLKPPGSLTHRFSTVDSKRFISLSADFLAITEGAYERWDMLKTEVRKAEAALQEVYRPAFYSRVGLRYKDLVSRDKLGLTGIPWKELLAPHISGELGATEISDLVLSTQTQTILQTPEVTGGRIRLIHQLVTVVGTQEQCYMIDVDLYVERKEGVVDESFGILDEFNHIAGRLFRWAIAPRLHDAMGPEPV